MTARPLGTFVSLLASLTLAASATALAAPLSPPIGFSPGQTISSSQVNANFTSIVNELNAKDTRISNLEVSRLKTFAASNSAQSFTIPAGITQVMIEAYGAGGGGGGAGTCTSVGTAGPGGPGGYSQAVEPVAAGDVLSVTVGSGGTGGSAASDCTASITAAGNGSAGTANTSVQCSGSHTWTVTAGRGTGGGGGSSIYPSCSIQGVTGTPGSGSGGYYNLSVPSPNSGYSGKGAAGTPGSGSSGGTSGCTGGGNGSDGFVVLYLF